MDQTITEATKLTRGRVLIGQDSSLITAAFHSNCGGETANSETVWLKSLPYLRSVNDPYCRNQPNANWERRISIERWKSYLRNKGFSVNKISKRSFQFNQKHRKKYYTIKNDSLLLKTIRNDWEFPSTFFEIDKSWNELDFTGRGYGHGVGMCQEGAMMMARKGFSYKEIIHFYYKNVAIINFFKWERMIFTD
jgi:stage II sporulation protein D